MKNFMVRISEYMQENLHLLNSEFLSETRTQPEPDQSENDRVAVSPKQNSIMTVGSFANF